MIMDCRTLRALMTGTHGPLWETSLEMAREHWQSCSPCKEEFPYALSTLDHIRSEMLLEIKYSFERTRHQFLSSEHQILADYSEQEEQSKYASILVTLWEKAADILW